MHLLLMPAFKQVTAVAEGWFGKYRVQDWNDFATYACLLVVNRCPAFYESYLAWLVLPA